MKQWPSLRFPLATHTDTHRLWSIWDGKQRKRRMQQLQACCEEMWSMPLTSVLLTALSACSRSMTWPTSMDTPLSCMREFKKTVFFIAVDFALERSLVRLWGFRQGRITSLDSFRSTFVIIMILLCNPPERVTAPAGLFMTPSVISEPKILPLDRKLPVVVATLPKEKQTKRVGSNPTDFLQCCTSQTGSKRFVSKTFY